MDLERKRACYNLTARSMGPKSSVMHYAALLLISSAPSNYGERVTMALSEALGEQAPQWKTRSVSDMATLTQVLAANPCAHLTVIDGPQTENLKWLAPVLAADSSACVLVLTDKLLPASETMQWIDAGATGFLRREFRGRDLTEPLREALAKRLRTNLAGA
ncbi:MAG: hypothetical protein JST16_07050 [Bdellovibrionales bacterium]|nr:hypothetical protein [Bdellovibrionales bacterium]